MNLLFDLDGTLADPIEAFAGSLDYAFDALKMPRISRAVMATLIGPPLHVELPRLLGDKNSGLTPEIIRLYREHHGQTGIYQYRFYPGVDEALTTLGGKNRVFVATSKPKVYADLIMKHYNKAHYFEFIYGCELSGVNSKKGDLIRHAMNDRALAQNDTVMIGDRKHDVIGALENKIPCIGVAWGYGSRDELNEAGARSVAGNWDELGILIKSLVESQG